jgi:hypothetical protein
MPEVWVSTCRSVTASVMVVPARSITSVRGASRSSAPSSTSCRAATDVNSFVADAVSNRVVSVTATGQRRLANP